MTSATRAIAYARSAGGLARSQGGRRGGASARPQAADQFRGIELQRLCQSHEVTHSDIAAALLQRTDVGAMQVRAVGELLL